MTIAEQYPARTDPVTGQTWYRAGSGPVAGWTSQAQYADPSYAEQDTLCHRGTMTPGDRAEVLKFAQFLEQQSQPEKESVPPMTELVEGIVETGRFTEFSHYPLPPELDRGEITFDGWRRYKLPSPSTGRLTAYTRATTVADTIEDFYTLQRWKQRMVACRLIELFERVEASDPSDDPQAHSMLTEIARLVAEDPSEKGLGRYLDQVDNVLGGADARELGGAVHDWLGALDAGAVLMHQIPDVFQPYAVAYQDCLKRAGLIAVPEWVERIVLNERGIEPVAGRLDRIYQCATDGCYYLGDLKTSKTLDFSALSYGTQFAVYAYAERMLRLDASGWDAMPKFPGIPHYTDKGDDDRDPMAFCVHVPSDQPERSQVVPFNLLAGAEGMVAALDVREKRRKAKQNAWGQAYPIPTAVALRYVEARQSLQAMSAPEQAHDIRENFEDVWDSDLDEFGAQCFELLTATTQEN